MTRNERPCRSLEGSKLLSTLKAQRHGAAPAFDAVPPRKPSRAPRASGPLLEAPTRAEVDGALAGMRSEIAACAVGRSGVAEIDLTIQSSGRVSHALISGDFAGTPQGSCIARTLRKARFSAFQKPQFRVVYRMTL